MRRLGVCLFVLWMTVSLWSVTAVVTTAQQPTKTQPTSLDRCYEAVCRISGCGSGCVFEISQGRVFVLTNAHVVGSKSRVDCEFWRRGFVSAKVPGQVVLRVRNGEVDAAVVAIDARHFDGLLPRAIPVAPRDWRMRAGDTIHSAGCPGAGWATAWQGHVVGYGHNGDLLFAPPPAGGRSGSALIDIRSNQIVGLLWGRDDLARQGRACSVQALHKHLARQSKAQRTARANHAKPVQCPPRSEAQPKQGAWRLLPYRHQQDRKDQRQNEQIGQLQQGQMYQNLPRSDLFGDSSGTNQRLDALLYEVRQLRRGSRVGFELDHPDGLQGRFHDRIEGLRSRFHERSSATRLLLFFGLGGVLLLIVLKDLRDKRESGDPLIAEKVAAVLSPTISSAVAAAARVASRIRDRFDDDEGEEEVVVVPKKVVRKAARRKSR